MRKWMKDRLKRRKKTDETAASQTAPLQPAYFEPEQQPQASTPPQKEEEFQPAAEPPEVETGGTGEGGEAEVPEPEDGAAEGNAPPRTMMHGVRGAGAAADAGEGARARNRPWFLPIPHRFRPELRKFRKLRLCQRHRLPRRSVQGPQKVPLSWRLDCQAPARVRGSNATT